MLVPAVLTRMKERDSFFPHRIDGAHCILFSGVAVRAGQRQVFQVVRSSSSAWQDVIHAKSTRVELFGISAVLTKAFGLNDDLLT
jgi:hypothetical protein